MRLQTEQQGRVAPDRAIDRAVRELGRRAYATRVLMEAGFIRPTRPDRLAAALWALRRWGRTPAAGFAGSAARYPDEPAVIDELGTLTFREVHHRTNALA